MKKNEKKDDVRLAAEHILDNYLEMNNHRKTPERYAILRAVYSIEGHFTLDELGDKLFEIVNANYEEDGEDDEGE